MARFFYKCLGRFALMTAAALWAGCDNAEKRESVKEEPARDISSSSLLKKEIKDSKYLPKQESIVVQGTTVLYGTMPVVGDCLYGCHTPIGESKAKGLVKKLTERDLKFEGSLSGEHLSKIVCPRTQGLRHIYNKFLKKKPGFEGRLVLQLTIAPDGSITNAVVKSSTTGYDDFDAEIKTAVSRWKFEKSDGITSVTVPFEFSESSDK
ncbi:MULTISPECIES: AgmX/PglI C-terminal domain-containing protein [unclassified Fibrobacter]|uniref:AgmX/PglI C-terminal domain-containing protein n=1 Tax=unclassified Fibrobacter TaxID=2634177 RepID=UPI001314D13B|nr:MULTISPECIES: AgmX/PglI C-terminal domain-containing protein [unclassified Fibrobacter]